MLWNTMATNCLPGVWSLVSNMLVRLVVSAFVWDRLEGDDQAHVPSMSICNVDMRCEHVLA